MSAGPAVDPRGPRFSAVLTTVVIAVVLITGWWPLLAIQTVIFALGAFAGLKYAPYGLVYRYVVAPRLAKTSEREDAAPLRFAQAVALFAAFINAAFNFCLGCEMYLLLKRFTPTTSGQAT
jgi:hypothetical protein